MIRDIVKDPLFLSIKSSDATIEDLNIGQDLIDTLSVHKHECVGMAANMIGFSKRIIVFADRGECMVMYNPTIVEKRGEYQTSEGCLSLPGQRDTVRYEDIVVEYDNHKFVKKRKTYHGFTAQIIQHEIDMTNGILI